MSEAPTLSTPSTLPSSRLDSLETSLHGEATNLPLGVDDLSSDPGITFRHSPWEIKRRCVLQSLKGITDAQNRTMRFTTCGSNAWVLESDDEPGLYRVTCDKCKDRFCDPCSQERARHIGRCVAEYAAERDLRFITLTLRHSDRTLTQDVDRLYSAFVKLRRRAKWKQTQKGGIFFVEIKRRRGDETWHVHLHIIAEGLNLSKHWLSETWQTVTGDSFIVDLKHCQNREKAAYYAAKYAGKGLHGSCYHDPRVLREGILALKGRRLVGKWGTWRNLDLNHDTPDGEWSGVDTLARLIARSERGDIEAATIIQSLIGVKPCPTNLTERPVRGP